MSAREQTPAAGLPARVLLAAGATLLALAAAEAALRLLRPPPADATPLVLHGTALADEPFGRWDRDLIYALVPHSRAFPEYAINARGWRSPEVDDARPPGALRVAVTGDSSTFGLGVSEAECWPGVLRGTLSGLFGDLAPVELVNAGTPGYTTMQYALQIERDLLPLRPDAIVVCVTGHNDTRLVVGEDDEQLTARHRAWATRLRRTRLGRLFTGFVEEPPNQRPLAPSEAAGGRRRVPNDRVEHHARAAIAACRAAGVPIVFAVTAPSRPVRAATPYVVEPGEVVARVCAELDVPLADLRPLWEAHEAHPLFVDSVHPTPYGHRLIAREVLGRVLAASRLPPALQARAGFARAADAALSGGLLDALDVLRGPHGPPAFAVLRRACEEAPAAGDPPGALPSRLAGAPAAWIEAAARHDPLHGSVARPRSLGAALLDWRASRGPPPAPEHAAIDARVAELRAHLLPGPSWPGCFGGPAEFLGTGDGERALARALLIAWAALGLPVERVDRRLGEGLALAQAGRDEEALARLDAARALDGGDAELLFQRAQIARRAGRSAESSADFARLAQLDPEGAPGLFAAGLLALDAGDEASAERALFAATRRRPSLGVARWMLGRLYLRAGRLEDALRELSVAQVLLGGVPEYAEALAQLAARGASAALR